MCLKVTKPQVMSFNFFSFLLSQNNPKNIQFNINWNGENQMGHHQKGDWSQQMFAYFI